LNLDKMISELRSQRQRLDDAIAALEGIAGDGTAHRLGGLSANIVPISGRPKRGHRGMSAAGRRRISEMMKARWAAHRSKSSGRLTTSAKKPKRRAMSAAARKRISKATKARWAIWRKKNKAA
jgi:hypothetical protein